MNLENIAPILWVSLLMVGLVITWLNLVSSLEDRHRTDRRWPKHLARRRVANSSVRNQSIIMTIMFLFIISGVVSMSFPPPRAGIAQITIYVSLISGVMLLVTLSLLERKDRKELLKDE